jgi:iron uptake system EfeUOB component EfeO/EfeM
MSVKVLRRSRRLTSVVALIALAAASFAAFRALGVGASGSAPTAAAPFVPLAEYAERSPHVQSSLNIVGIEGAVRGESDTPPPDQPPIAADSFTGPVARYISYSVGQLTLLEGDVASLEQALRSGNRTSAQAAWSVAFARYLHLGAVYLEGPVATLNDQIDGNPGGLPGGTASPKFTGLHRIEFGLWTGAPTQALVPFATRLATDVDEMRTLLPHVKISPLEYATRAHEILEDAVRDLLSGTDVPWSGEGVLGTAAGLAATREVISTLRPLLVEPAALAADPPANPRSPAVVDADLDQLQSVLTSLAAAHGGTLPTNGELTQSQAEALDAAIGGALEGLDQIPGMLETQLPPTVRALPASAVRIDP